ncbi:unnamed protein product [Prorocentrum cordatum]|uniref:Fatty acid desaturase domain-containing protein n=1 Tax=Prorocentrum cordatum TaxID=2364126 RepID=A0ABN9W904_9DINO|nr:unnamed protein product [Polarella glacialis]
MVEQVFSQTRHGESKVCRARNTVATIERGAQEFASTVVSLPRGSRRIRQADGTQRQERVLPGFGTPCHLDGHGHGGGYGCWQQHVYVAMVVAMFAHGTVGSAFIFGCHELGHGTVFKTRWLNRFFLYIFSVLWWWDPIDYAMSHTYHHRYTEYAKGDRENLFPLEPSLNPTLLLQLFSVDLFGTPGRVFGKGGLLSTVKLTFKAACGGIASEPYAPSHEWLQTLHKDQPHEALKSMWFSQCIVIFHVSVFAASIVSGQWIFILIVNFHKFCAMWLTYFMGQTQHIGLKSDSPDFRKNTRTITLDPVSEFLYWHMNWHIEHHMFAGVPCYNLRALHEEVSLDMPAPRTLLGAWREMRETWHRQQADPEYEFDTPLPEFAGSSAKAVNLASEEQSGFIGDLAPTGLADAEMFVGDKSL